MTSIIKFPAFGVVFAILTLFGAGCVAPSMGDETDDVAAFLQEVVDARDDAMRSGDVTIYETYFASGAWPSASPLVNEYEPAILAGMRDRMIAQDTDIVDLSSTTTITSIDVDDGIVAVRFTIDSAMLVSVAGQVMAEPSLSRGEYRAELRRESGRLLITGFELDYGGGVSMTIEPHVVNPDDLGIAPATSAGSIDFGAPTPLAYYSSTAATYSDRWAMGRNPAYLNLAGFYPAYLGGDCTNFVSQALYAGGRRFTTGPETDNRSWWYNPITVCPWNCWSRSWAGAANLWANLITTPAGASVGISSLRSGDLIFADWEPDGAINHVMIVSQRVCLGDAWACVQINQHTEDRYRRQMSVTVAAAPTARFYPVRPVF